MSCLYSLPWLAVVAITDGSFALGMLLISLAMGGRNWHHLFEKAWFVPLVVFCAVLYAASFPLILQGWNKSTSGQLKIGYFTRATSLFIIYVYIFILLPSHLSKYCLDVCSSSGPQALIYAGMFLLDLGTVWPQFMIKARIMEVATGIRPTFGEVFRGRITRVAPAPAGPPAPSAHPSTRSNANAKPEAFSPSGDVERGDKAARDL